MKNLIRRKIFFVAGCWSVLACLIFSSCGSSGLNNSVTGSAIFDYFTYVGEEEYPRQDSILFTDDFNKPILTGWNSYPDLCTNGREYFLVTSNSIYFPGIPIFHSNDLVNWEQVGYVLNRPSQLRLEGQLTNQGILAPSINYNNTDSTYYLITTNYGGGNFYVKSKDPFGDWSDPIWLPEVHGIHLSFFFDEDGKTYILKSTLPASIPNDDLFWTISIQEFDLRSGNMIGSEKTLYRSQGNEGQIPQRINLYNINGRYYLVASQTNEEQEHSSVVLLSESLLGGFTSPGNTAAYNHGGENPPYSEASTSFGLDNLIADNSGNWWTIFPALRSDYSGGSILGQEVFLRPVSWTNNNVPYLTVSSEKASTSKHIEAKQPSNTLAGIYRKKETFGSPELDMGWMTLRRPATGLFSLTKRQGYLVLNCAPITASEISTPAFVARKILHKNFSADTRVDLLSKAKEDAAGILLYKDESHQYFLAVSEEGKSSKIRLIKISESGNTILEEKEVREKRFIGLRVESKGDYFNFYYSTDKSDLKLLAQKIDASFLSANYPIGFPGITMGMYATSKLNMDALSAVILDNKDNYIQTQ